MKRFNLHNIQTKLFIPLGINKFDENEVVCMEERLAFGVNIIAAVTRYGKSILVKNRYTHVGQYRPVIILDYLGEHSKSKYPNFLSQHDTKCLPNLVEIKDFRFKISQFNTANDWRSLGLANKSSLVMEDLCKQKRAHRDDPLLFKEMLDDLPFDWSMVKKFDEKWGFEMPKLNHAVIETINTKYLQLQRQGFFAENDDPLFDFGTFALKHHSLSINFQLNETEVEKARAIAGKVLEQIEKVINKMDIKPLIVVEEADVLAPNIYTEGVVISSLERLLKWVLKLQKQGIEMDFIVQDPQNLHSSIVGNAHTLILGQLPENNQYASLTRKLRWNIDENYREFVILRKGRAGYQVFIPHDSNTLY